MPAAPLQPLPLTTREQPTVAGRTPLRAQILAVQAQTPNWKPANHPHPPLLTSTRPSCLQEALPDPPPPPQLALKSLQGPPASSQGCLGSFPSWVSLWSGKRSSGRAGGCPVREPLHTTENSPGGRCGPQPAQECGALRSGFCSQAARYRKGNLGKAESVSELPPPGTPLPPPPPPLPRPTRSSYPQLQPFKSRKHLVSRHCFEPWVLTLIFTLLPHAASPQAQSQAKTMHATPTQGLTEAKKQSHCCSPAPPPPPPALIPGPVVTTGVWVQTKLCSSGPGFDDSSTRTPFSLVPSCVPSPSEPDTPGGPPRAQAQLPGWGSEKFTRGLCRGSQFCPRGTDGCKSARPASGGQTACMVTADF